MNPTAQILMLLLELSSKYNNNYYDNTGESSNGNDLMFSTLLESALKGTEGFPSDTNNTSLDENLNPEVLENNNNSITEIIRNASQKYGVDENLITEVIKAESSFNKDAVSSAGAQGLMQLMPETAKSYGVSDPFNAIQNVNGGTHLLSDLLEKYNGNVQLALAAYNAGPGAVNKYQGIPPYSETQAYVKKIISNLGKIDAKI